MTTPKTFNERRRDDVHCMAPGLLEQAASGDLQRSLHAQRDRNAASVGANLIYAAIHQFGAKQGQFTIKKGRPIPWGDIPARPCLGVRDQERKPIRNAIIDHLRARQPGPLANPASTSPP